MSNLPESWQSASLLEVAALLRGVTFSKADSSDVAAPGFVPVLRATNIIGRELTLSDLVYVPQQFVSDDQMVRRGDIVVATSSGSISVVGKAACARRDLGAAFGAFCGLLRPDESVEPRYVGYYLGTEEYRRAASEMAQGVNINNLKREHFASFQLPVAPLAEQRRIADKLDDLLARVDACRDRLDRIPGILKRFRQAVLAAATSGELTRDWRGDDLSSGFPAGWNETTLGALCEQGRVITYGVIKLGDETVDGVPCLRTSNVRWLRVDVDGVKKIAPALSAEYGRTILRGGEVLVNVRGTLGGVAVVGPEMRGWNVSREVAVVPGDSNRISSAFLAYWIADERSQRWLAGVEKGVAYTGINIEDLRTLPVRLPSIEEQIEIANRVKLLMALIDQVELRHRGLEELVKDLPVAILSKAFRGELVPQDSNDEPASVLLDRIRAERAASGPAPKKRGRSPKVPVGAEA